MTNANPTDLVGDYMPAWSRDGNFIIYTHYARNQVKNAANCIGQQPAGHLPARGE